MCHLTPPFLFSTFLSHFRNTTEYLNTTERHTHREMPLYCFKIQTTVAPHEPRTPSLPFHGRTSCDRVSYTPELTELFILVQTIGGLADLEHSAPQ